MKRIVLAFAVVFAFGGMCTGAMDGGDATDDGDDDDKDKTVVVVPVPEGDGDEEHFCCEYAEEEDGPKKFALTEGPAECNDKYGDQDGKWRSGSECTPCCCKSPNDEDDDDAGFAYELTTPMMCVDVGDCLAGDADECEGKGPKGDDDDDDAGKDHKRKPLKPARPGSGGGAKRPGR